MKLEELKAKAQEYVLFSKEAKSKQKELIKGLNKNLLVEGYTEHLSTIGECQFFDVYEIHEIYNYCCSSQKYLEAKKKSKDDAHLEPFMFVFAVMTAEGITVDEAIDKLYDSEILGKEYKEPDLDETLTNEGEIN